MTITVADLPVTGENIAAAMLFGRQGFEVMLADRRPKAHRVVRLYIDRDGVPFIRDRLFGRRNIVAIRFLYLDGHRLERGTVVLAPIAETPSR
jgi:hypothetical protein